jgi:hypothetical protein
MEDILYAKDMYDPLENEGKKPEGIDEAKWNKINRKTIGLIRQWIGPEVFHHVAKVTSAFELWEKLETMYQSKTSRNKALLMRRLVNMKLRDEKSVAEHTSEFQNLINQLNSVEMTFENEVQALLLLSSLPDSWETLVVSLGNSAPNGKLTMELVKDALFSEEARRKEMGTYDYSGSQALITERGRRSSRNTGGRDQSRGRGRKIICFYCDQEGHIKRNCPKYKAEKGNSSEASVVTDDSGFV